MKDRKYREVVRFTRLPDDPWTAQASWLSCSWGTGRRLSRQPRILFALPERLRTYPIRDIIPRICFTGIPTRAAECLPLRELKKIVGDFVGSFSSGFAGHVPASQTHDGWRNHLHLDVPLLFILHVSGIFRVGDAELDGVSFSGMPLFLSAGPVPGIFVVHGKGGYPGLPYRNDAALKIRSSTRSARLA